MKVLKNIVTFLLVLGASGFFVLISFNFTWATPVISVFDEVTELVAYKVKIQDNKTEWKTIEKTKIEALESNPVVHLDTSEAGYIEFWKLSTAFFLWDSSWSLSFENMRLSGATLTIDSQYTSIVSLYDPFTIYTIESAYGDFSITQVTNGSFYVWREKDGTYSLYSIDSVVRLDFLDKGVKMTDMVLFPGMYIRFDPKMNASLSWANLFRILQSLEPNGTEDKSTESTGIEFVNPRMNTKNEKDSFLMYRLPTQTKLFQMLHILFSHRVSQIDLYKEYGTAIWLYSDESSSNSHLINPWKESHLLLLKLDGILANALKNPTSIEVFKSRIAEVNSSASSLGLWNSVEARLEKFLTDGRFALFAWTKNTQFAQIYQAASEAVGKAPVTPHAKLLQKLSDIYSKNLVTQKKDLSFSNIDTYTPTALELEKTLLSTDIQQRDYFDIALYAFNVLKKMEDRWFFTEEAMSSHPTYTLIQTVLVSTDRYVRDIKDTEKKAITYEGIALHFYYHIIGTLTRSTYASFMDVEDGKLFLRSAYAPAKNEEKIRIDDALIRDISSVDSMLSIISERMDEQYGTDSSNNTYLGIKRHIALYHAFVDLLDYEQYLEYQKTPYLVDGKEDSKLPLYASGNVVRYDPTKVVVEDVVPTDDPVIEKIQSILWNIPKSNIEKEGNEYVVNNAELSIAIGDAAPITFTFSIVFSSDATTFSNPVVTSSGRVAYLLTDKKNIEDLQWVMAIIPQYIVRLDTILAWNPGLVWGVRFLDTTKKIAIGTYLFPLVP